MIVLFIYWRNADHNVTATISQWYSVYRQIMQMLEIQLEICACKVTEMIMNH